MREFPEKTLSGVKVTVEEFPDDVRDDVWSLLEECAAFIPRWLHVLTVINRPMYSENGSWAEVIVLWEYGDATIKLYLPWQEEKKRNDRRVSIIHELIHIELARMHRQFTGMIDAACKDDPAKTFFLDQGIQALEVAVTNLSEAVCNRCWVSMGIDIGNIDRNNGKSLVELLSKTDG